jgi:hypothetical protein
MRLRPLRAIRGLRGDDTYERVCELFGWPRSFASNGGIPGAR